MTRVLFSTLLFSKHRLVTYGIKFWEASLHTMAFSNGYLQLINNHKALKQPCTN